ncbi:Fructose-bisphosphate aldolase class II [hydrothermal vent metagenome]|uniref:Fructose-bisphosphate aldolase class II n=1 Tax=hydrothermal vent metagenome TaxID=652676 RepID=A0A3B0UNE7_9ZZZZ
MKLQEKFIELRNNGKALLATNFYNFETLEGVLQAAKASRQSIILQLTRSSIDYMGLPVAFNLAKTMLDYHGVGGWIHLDHGNSYELAARCLDIGFDSVMIDASEQPFKDNIAVTTKVVKLAESYNANVEAELGYIAKLGQEKDGSGFTQPKEAKLFVEETGVNALAVAIGTAHGFYDKEPKLDLERLSEIAKITDAALVLHGGSGIPGASLQQAIDRGVCKINLATEIKNMFMKTLKNELLNNDEIDLRKVFPVATKRVTELVIEKLKIVENGR